MKNQLNETWNSGNVLIHRIETGMSAPFKIGSSKRVCNWNQTTSLLTRPEQLLYWNYWIVQTNWNSFKRTRSTIVSSPFLQTNRESKLCDSRFLRRFVRKAKKLLYEQASQGQSKKPRTTQHHFTLKDKAYKQEGIQRTEFSRQGVDKQTLWKSRMHEGGRRSGKKYFFGIRLVKGQELNQN
jgi:hypothetical protein